MVNLARDNRFRSRRTDSKGLRVPGSFRDHSVGYSIDTTSMGSRSLARHGIGERHDESAITACWV